MILLDTNVVSEAMRPGANRRVVDWLNAQDLRTLHLSTISLAELGYGIAALPDGRRKNELKARLEATEDRVFGDRILAFDRTAAAEFSERMAAARKAGRSLVKDFREVENLQVSVKGAGDFVSRADREAERIIKEELRGARPNYGWLGEETGMEAGEDPTRRWIVDPLDGTTNFLHGIPHFAISIGVEHLGTIVAGIVYQPMTDESFWAERGRGAWLQNARLRVSGRRELDESLLATGIPYKGHGDQRQFESILQKVIPEVAGVRRFGAASLDLAWVAAGRFDGFWEQGLQPWDVAAGMLLVKEAGGFVSDFRGGERMVERREILAANDQIHSKLHKLVGAALR